MPVWIKYGAVQYRTRIDKTCLDKSVVLEMVLTITAMKNRGNDNYSSRF